MKIKEAEFITLKKQKFQGYDGILFYGPDRGKVIENTENTINEIVNDTNDGFSFFNLEPSEIKSTPSILIDEITTISFLNEPKAIKIKDATDDIAPTIQTLIDNYKKWDAFLVISAGELPPISKLRQLFEKNNRLLILPSYLDESINLTTIIKQTLSKSGIKNIPDDVLLFLRNKLGEDHNTTKMELEKLALYLYGKTSISVNDIKNVIMDSSSINIYDLPLIVASGDNKKLNQILPRLIEEGNYPITLLKIILSHFKKLFSMAIEKENGKTIFEIIDNVKPPIFYKQKPIYEKQLSFWNSAKIKQVIVKINETDKKCKSGILPQDILLSHLLFSICSFVNSKK